MFVFQRNFLERLEEQPDLAEGARNAMQMKEVAMREQAQFRKTHALVVWVASFIGGAAVPPIELQQHPLLALASKPVIVALGRLGGEFVMRQEAHKQFPGVRQAGRELNRIREEYNRRG